MNRALAIAGQLPGTKDVLVVVEPRLVSLTTAGQMYGDLSDDTIRKLTKTAGFPHIRIGTRILIPIAAADAWFAARQGSAA